MVTISVDEGYAFDILSIFQVKIHNCTDKVKLEASKRGFSILYEELKDQLGQDKLSEIIYSKEYDDLYTENQTTFVLVDAIRASNENSIGKDIDLNNLRRFECKRKLQSKFFNTDMVETKTKYE
jgi:deoxyribodipyrimidine photolyase-like uncharacterized protein